MAPKTSPRRDIVAKILKAHPKSGKQTLAKLLHKRHPEEFVSVKNARDSICYYTGASGKKNRGKPGVLVQDIRPPSTLKIPKGIRQTKKPLSITDAGKWLICSDWHVPYHDEEALEACFKFAQDEGCENLYLNGDGIDFYKSSQWIKDPRARNLQKELETLWTILDSIGGMFGRKVYKIGNHEDRFTRRLWGMTPELAVLRRFDVDRVLEVRERDYEVVDSKRHARMNGLNVFHGHELAAGFNQVNVARGLWMKTAANVMAGHSHRTSSHLEVAGLGKTSQTCLSVGCLCQLEPDYAPVNKWNHGFAIVELQGSGYRATNYTIDRGKVFSAG